MAVWKMSTVPLSNGHSKVSKGEMSFNKFITSNYRDKLHGVWRESEYF